MQWLPIVPKEIQNLIHSKSTSWVRYTNWLSHSLVGPSPSIHWFLVVGNWARVRSFIYYFFSFPILPSKSKICKDGCCLFIHKVYWLSSGCQQKANIFKFVVFAFESTSPGRMSLQIWGDCLKVEDAFLGLSTFVRPLKFEKFFT
jgi:hypothetical protein